MTRSNPRIDKQPRTGNQVIAFPDPYPILVPNSNNTADPNFHQPGSGFPISEQLNMELLKQKLDQLGPAIIQPVDDDDWSLDGDQALFMLQHNNLIEAAFATGDMSDLDELVESDEFTSIFQGMGFDEAYDRYQTMLEEGRA